MNSKDFLTILLFIHSNFYYNRSRGEVMILSRFIPTWYEPHLHDINLEFLKNNGIQIVFCDLDNTLVAHHLSLPDSRAIAFINSILKNEMTLCVISNNREERVSNFCKNLPVLYLASTKKPRRSRLIRFIESHQFDLDKCVIVGDQLLTDVWLANRLGCRSILVEPAVDSDLLITKLNRLIDRKIRSYFKRKRLLRPMGQRGGDLL